MLTDRMEDRTDYSKLSLRQVLVDWDRAKGLLYILSMTKGVDFILKIFDRPDAGKAAFGLSIFCFSFANSCLFDKHLSSSISLYFILRFFVAFTSPRFTSRTGPKAPSRASCSSRGCSSWSSRSSTTTSS